MEEPKAKINMDKIKEIEEILTDWKKEVYDDTATLSEIIRYLSFAGIGLIWIFNKTQQGFNLPKQLNSPLIFIVLCLITGVIQLLWRSVTIYITYKLKRNRYYGGRLTEAEKKDLKLPNYIAVGSWTFFVLKLCFLVYAYWEILWFLL